MVGVQPAAISIQQKQRVKQNILKFREQLCSANWRKLILKPTAKG
jgi:hypothetical protein